MAAGSLFFEGVVGRTKKWRRIFSYFLRMILSVMSVNEMETSVNTRLC